MSNRYILIGASAASMGALHKLRQLDPHGQIIIFSAESELPYNKCFLADFLSGTCIQERLNIYRSGANTTLHLNTRIMNIDSQNKTVIDQNNNSYSYDALFLAMGSSPWMPEITGIKTEGVFTFHTLADTHSIQSYIQSQQPKRAIVCGAGLSGLEAADALATQGIRVTLIEKSSQVLPTLITSSAADFLHDHIRSREVELILGQRVFSIEESNGKVKGVRLTDESFLPADMVIMATGLKANTQLCKPAGIECGPQGVMVNEFLQTSQSAIFAGGDLIQVTDSLTGMEMRSCMWPDAMQQGMLAASAMVGQPKAYPGPALIVSSAFFGLKFAQAGRLNITRRLVGADFYHEISQEQGLLKGFLMLGTRHDLGQLKRFILSKQPFLDSLDSMLWL